MHSGKFLHSDDFIANRHLLPTLNTYIYILNDKQYIYYGSYLSDSFFLHNKFINPYDNYTEFTTENIRQLIVCAKIWCDFILLNAIDFVTNIHHINTNNTLCRIPSEIIRSILYIGLFLLGWKGSCEPFPHKIREISDFGRIAMKLDSLLRNFMSSYEMTEKFLPAHIRTILIDLSHNIDFFMSTNLIIAYGIDLVSYASHNIPYSSSLQLLLQDANLHRL